MRVSSCRVTAVAALALNGAASAHVVDVKGASASTFLLSARPEDAATLLPIAIAFFWFAAGVQRTISEGRAHVIAPTRLLAFAGGMIVLVIALQSPVDAISEDLFSVHMVQHLLLMLAAPPLLVWSDCPMVFLRALPRPTRKAVARAWAPSALSRVYEVLMHPLIVWMLFCSCSGTHPAHINGRSETIGYTSSST